MKKHCDMTCEQFTAGMAELIASGKNIFAHPHVKSCKMHRALLEDLEAIVVAAQQLFPDVDPSDKVWSKIKDQIAPLGGLDELISEPFSGFRLVVRTKVVQNGRLQDNPMAYDNQLGGRNVFVPGMRIKASGHRSPPYPGEGRRG
ncbi:MAG TPA: hypothetical protein VGL22_19045 [Terracidiphilus sp.]|jgi:hypothetical protein